MKRAVVLGGTGAIGWAVTRRLTVAGWEVTVTGRDPGRVPTGFPTSSASFLASDRHDRLALATVLAGGADLLVDCVCYTAEDAAALIPLLADVTSAVMISSKAVYVDDQGRHSNSESPPLFARPIAEDQPTLRPNGAAYNSRDGYGPNKVAAEETLLGCGHPVTVLRASKVHGACSRQPREWHFVKRVLDRRPAVLLARGGRGADHPSAALNLAALIQTVAEQPGRRVLNAADPDCPDGRRIAQVIAARLGHRWQEVALDDGAPEGLGWHPWDRFPPVVLDTGAARRLGYIPCGDYATTVADEIDWLVSRAAGEDPDRSFAALVYEYGPAPDDYAAEDSYLSALRV